MRYLGATRQSRTRDHSISLEAQRDAILAYAPDATITTDPSTSGGTSVFDRTGVGPWFARPEDWDCLVATKLDRLCRDTSDFLKLRDWLAERGKKLVLLNQPQLDDSTPAGRMMATLLAVFAEFEREMIKERARERHATITDLGRWPGGKVPFGQRKVKRPDGWYLEPDPDSPLVDMVAEVIAGKSVARAAAERGMYGNTVLTTMRREAEKNEELAEALARREQPQRGQWTSGRHMLLNVAFCKACNGTLYGNIRGGRTPLYRCRVCKRAIAKDWLEGRVEAELRGRWGSRKRMVPHVVKGDDNAAEIRKLERQREAVVGIPGVDVSGLDAIITSLRQQPHVPDRIEWIETEGTIAEHWESLDVAGRGEFLREQEVRVTVDWHLPPPNKPAYRVEATWHAASRDWGS